MTQSQRGLFVSCILGFTFLFLVFLVANVARASEQNLDVTTAAAQDGAQDVARAYLDENSERWGLTAADLESLVVVDQYVSRHTGVTHLYLWQTHAELEVFGAIFNISVAPDGSVVHAGNRLIPNLAANVNTGDPKLSAEAAVHTAAAALKLSVSEPLVVRESLGGPAQATVFSEGGISREPIPVKLVYQPTEKGDVRLAWNVEIYELSGDHYWSVRLDAVDGALLSQADYVTNDHWGAPGGGHSLLPSPNGVNSVAGDLSLQTGSPSVPQTPDSYYVYAIPKEYPDDGPRTLEVDPADLTASPYGWHDTDGAAGAEYTVTRGNNAHAYTDVDDNDLPDAGSDPDGGAGLVFSYTLDLAQEPNTYPDAAVTNLFYWNNVIHDVFYLYGFDEPSGNFQVNNYGNGGAGSDDVRAEGQDGDGLNNANFFTPADGSRPRMQMFLWNQTVPGRDGDLENMIIAHEYGHGISIRLTGGPANVFCLTNAEQMGEGWSDFFGLVLTANGADTGPTSRGVGTYVLGQPTTGPGIRPTPYSTDLVVNPTTYSDISGLAVPHGVGYAWASIIWEVYWALVDQYGFNADIYQDWTTGGNNLALQLVVDGLKLQPCSPGFVDGRDAILSADAALTGGANQCILWEAFAKRGLGYSADQGDSDNTGDGTEAFDTPPACDFIYALPATQNICAATPAIYEVSVGDGYTSPPVTLSASGEPAGTTVTFANNPVNTVPATTTMTVGNTAGAAAGTYTITITGDDGVDSESGQVGLGVFDAAPGATTLTAPANGANNVPFQPTFVWTAASQTQSYLLEVDDDPVFGSIAYSATVTMTNHTATTPLTASTTYYWRVTPQNECGSTPSASSSFSTHAPEVCNTSLSADFEAGIPGDWTVVDASTGGLGIDWTTTADTANCGIGNLTGGIGEAACADSDAAGSGSPAYDTQLTSPTFDLSAASQANLDFRAYYREYSGSDFFDVDIWDGAMWTNLLHWEENHGGTPLSLDLASYLGEDDLQVRFRYAGPGWDWYAQVDDVSMTACSWYSVELSPDAQQSDAPGSDVVYSVQITNTGSTIDTFDLATSGNSWTTVLSDASVMLAAGASTTVDVTVSIPAGANDGDSDSVIVTATSQGNGTQSATAVLQTTAELPMLYLPAIFKP